jgi:hypothetical protein
MQVSRTKTRLLFLSIASLVMAILPEMSGTAQASTPQFASVMVRFDNSTSSTIGHTPAATQYTGGSICVLTPATGVGTEDYVDVGFPAEESGGADTITSTNDYDVSTTAANWVVNTTQPGTANTGQNYWPLLGSVSATAWPGITAPTVTGNITDTQYAGGDKATKKVVRFATGALSASTTYCFNWTTGNTGTTYSLRVANEGLNGYQEYVPGFVATYNCTGGGCTAPGSGTELMSSNWGTQITFPPGNQILVSAVVPPIFIMTFGGNTDAFATNLDPNGPVDTNGQTVEVQTNAKGGWVVWTKDSNQGLSSASSGGHIPTVGWNGGNYQSLTCGGGGPACTPLYAMLAQVTSNFSGAGTTLCGPTNTPVGAEVETEYGGGGTPGTLANADGGALEANWAETADCSTSTPPGTDAGTQIKFYEIATINFNTPAASDYTDTIYVVGAGNF